MSLSCGPKIGSKMRGDSHLGVKLYPSTNREKLSKVHICNMPPTTSPKSLRECTQRAQKRVVPMHPRAAIANHTLGVDEVDRPAYRPVFLTRTVERGDLRPGIVEERKRQPQLGLVTLMVVQGPRIDPEDGGVTGLERLPLLLQGDELAAAVWGIIPDVKHP